ncbi:unnamed protein product (mitochondrion) [Plasmodiophora brassicae]|uniref:Uncharacterized protein n=1 Tax=Plasmodiophora brassicae TaxID=37360 RepID=A0A3P3YLM9_PLABS|nr:unnamed protein product [Plasmodiophora brassicae]
MPRPGLVVVCVVAAIAIVHWDGCPVSGSTPTLDEELARVDDVAEVLSRIRARVHRGPSTTPTGEAVHHAGRASMAPSTREVLTQAIRRLDLAVYELQHPPPSVPLPPLPNCTGQRQRDAHPPAVLERPGR